MIAIRISDTKDFMTKLLMKSFFDSFLVSEAQITTYTTFTIDGTWHPDFFLTDEQRAQARAQRAAALADAAQDAGTLSAREGAAQKAGVLSAPEGAAQKAGASSSGKAAAQDAGAASAGIAASQNPVSAGLSWKRIRPLFTEIIRGRYTPLSFHLVLKLSPSNVGKLLQTSGITQISPAQVAGLFLNISYQDTGVTCVTGSSLNIFTLDKTLEHTWDDMALHFFKVWQIECETL